MKNSSNLWICCNARTGSNYLCELLNNLHKFEVYKDNKAFAEWIRWLNKEEFLRKPPLNAKMIFEQFNKILPNTTASDIKNIMPNIKFVYLKRNNTLEHLSSLYFARFTGAYYLSNKNQLEWYYNLPVKFYPILIKTLYEEIIEYQNNWNNFLTEDYLTIEYEDLIENPQKTIEKIAEYCEIRAEIKLESSLVKMTRPELSNFIAYAKQVLFKKVL